MSVIDNSKIEQKSRSPKVYKAHKIAIFYNLKPVLFVLLLPIIKALINSLLRREINGFFLSESLILAVLFTYGVLKWRNFSISITDNLVKVSSGLFLRRTAEISVDKISTIQRVRTLPDRIFGSTTLTINTEAGRKGKADYKMRLCRVDADEIYNTLSGTTTAKTLKFSPLRVAVMSAAASSAFTGIILIVPAIKTAGNLLGTAIEEALIDRINEVSLINRLFPPIINTITIIFLSLYGVAVAVSFFRSVNFKVSIGSGKIEISNGLLTLRKISFKKKTVNCAVIEQAPLMRMCKRYLVRVGVGGYGDNKGNKGVVVPSAKRNEVHELFGAVFPNVQKPETLIRPSIKARPRFHFKPTIFTAIMLAVYIVLSDKFPAFDELIIFGGIIAAIVLVYYYTLAEYNARRSAIGISNIIYAKYTHWAATREMFCEADRIGIINITKWPLDRKIGTCNIKLTVRSENAESIRVKHIDYDEIKEQLSDFYKFE